MFTYYINLDERGEFYADVRNENEETVYEIMDTLSELVEDGFMKHGKDLIGLEKMLKQLGIMPKGSTLEFGN